MRLGPILPAVATLLAAACSTPPPPSALPPARPDLSRQDVRLALPSDRQTIGEAAEWLLAGSGYALVLHCRRCPPSAPAVAGEPVSALAYARPNELTSIARALLLVLGSDRRLIVDDTLRLVTFDAPSAAVGPAVQPTGRRASSPRSGAKGGSQWSAGRPARSRR